MESENLTVAKYIAGIIGIGILIIILLSLSPIVIIGTGNRGVVFNNTTGIEDKVLGEGLHFRIPFIQNVKTLSVQVQKNEVGAQAASRDLQTVTTKIVVNWHLDPAKVNKIYQSVGDEKTVVDRILIPNTNEVVKAATAQYTAEELLTKRPDLKNNIDLSLTQRLNQYNILLDDVSIVDIDFSDEFNKAIEAKATAEQNALAEKNKLETFKYQAQQKIETARGEADSTVLKAKAEAESIRIQGEALSKNPALVELELAKRWNGVLPTTMVPGSSVPFINVK